MIKKAKRFLAVLLALAMSLSLAACSSGSGGTETQGSEAGTELSSEAAGEEQNSDAAVTPGEYAYDETMPFGTVTWNLTLAEDGTYSLAFTNLAGTEYVYTGTYEVDGSTVITGTPAEEDTSGIEADFFNDDLSCAWVVTGEGTVEPENAGEGSDGEDLSSMDFSNVSLQGDVEPADAVGNTYIYEEANEEYGFTTAWELTFTSESECTLYEPNDVMGSATYTCTYTYEDGQYTVTIVDSDSGSIPMSSMFDEDYTCVFAVWGDGDFKPANGSGDGEIDLSGLTGSSEGSEDADYPAVAYASNSSAQVMDIFLPENATGSDPVIVLVHGGGFMFGSQTMDIIQPVIAAGIANGYVVASVDYRKSSEATFPGALADVKAAIRYLKANAEEYGIDPEKVVIWGESAGAYLSLMTALTPEVEDLDGDVTDNADQSSTVAALVDFYGPVEFYTMDDEYAALGIEGTTYSSDSSFESNYVGQAIGEDEEYTYTTWWGTYIDQLPEGYALSAWIQAGDSDTSVPYTQSQNFAGKLAEVIGEENVNFSIIEGAEHEDALFYTDENLAQIFEFLTEVLA